MLAYLLSNLIQTTSEELERRRVVEGFFEHGPAAVAAYGQAAFAAPHGPAAPVAYGVPGYPGVYNIVLTNTGSGMVEQFLVQPASPPPSSPAPLLVAFHRYNVGHGDALLNTSLFAEASARGWHVLAPLGASQYNFGSVAAQVNTQAALEWATNHLLVDPSRIYAVGMSMGAGWALSYAARHLDPGEPMFAAVVNHTGGVALLHTHAHEGTAVTGWLEHWFGPPMLPAFDYLRSSTIGIDAVSGTVTPGNDMARNLAHVPLYSWVAAGDPVTYLITQVLTFQKHVQDLNPANELRIVAGNQHTWATMGDVEACDWLARFQLRLPTQSVSGQPPAMEAGVRTLADRDGRFFLFDVQQSAVGAFTPFGWRTDSGANRLWIYETSNLHSIAVDATELGLRYAGTLYVMLWSEDAQGDRLELREVPAAPQQVWRDGVPASFGWDPIGNVLTIQETASKPHFWWLQF